MPLFARSTAELTTNAIEELSSNTNFTRFSPGAKARAMLDAVNRNIEGGYNDFDLNIARAFVSSASGRFLELVGGLLGVTREISVAATASSDLQVVKFYVASGTFGDINSSNDIPLTPGSVISTGPASTGILYRISSPATAFAGDSIAWVSVEAVGTGEEYNLGSSNLVYHDITGYTDVANGTLLVTNVHAIDNGKNLESDENYRFRIVNAKLEAEAANETAVRLAALTAPGVADVDIIRHYRGIGTFGVIIKGLTPTVPQSIIDDVVLRVRKVQGLGSVAFVRKAKETGLVFDITVHYKQRQTNDELDLLEQFIEDTITEEVNSLDTGEPFSVARLASALFGVSDNIENLGEPGQPFDNIYIYKTSRLDDNRVRAKLLGDYSPDFDERVIIEPSVTNPFTFARKFRER